jgi:hypothetical protein
VTLREIPEEEGVVTSLCERKALTLISGSPAGTIVEGPQSQQCAAQAAVVFESQKLTAARVLN